MDIPAELIRWKRALQAERKSASTIRAYTDGVRAWLRWAGGNQGGDELPPLTRTNVQAW